MQNIIFGDYSGTLALATTVQNKPQVHTSYINWRVRDKHDIIICIFCPRANII